MLGTYLHKFLLKKKKKLFYHYNIIYFHLTKTIYINSYNIDLQTINLLLYFRRKLFKSYLYILFYCHFKLYTKCI